MKNLIEPLLVNEPSAGENPPTLELKKHGGAGRGQGRKKSNRAFKIRQIRIFADHEPISDSEIRTAIDIYLSSRGG